jgi:MFS family permease
MGLARQGLRMDAPAWLRPLLTVWLAWLALMAGANLATPLYAVYAQRFHFSSLVLTAVFATYAFTLVPALVLFGRLSDGRRPVILAGLAVGMISGTATAALVELDPGSERSRVAMLAGRRRSGSAALAAAVWQLRGATPRRAAAPTRRGAARRYGVAPR